MSLIISDEIVKASQLSEKDLMLEIIIMLFEKEKISLAKASHLANMSQLQFQHLIGSRGICIHYSVEEFREDMKSLQENGWR